MTAPTPSGAPSPDSASGSSSGAASAKARLRAEMRALRRSITAVAERSSVIGDVVRSIPAVADAGVVMVFSPIAGEPDLAGLVEWCRAGGIAVVVPEDDPDPSAVDVVVVPGLAFTVAGDRLGQGGGWYDRFLAGVGSDAVTIGVCFGEQLVDRLPIEPHDVRVDHVVTDAASSVSRHRTDDASLS